VKDAAISAASAAVSQLGDVLKAEVGEGGGGGAGARGGVKEGVQPALTGTGV
jgi:hypothetical protein